MNSDLKKLVHVALLEDGTTEDITSLACVPEDAVTEAEIVMKTPGIICGLPLIPLTFGQLGGGIELTTTVQEGTVCAAGTVVTKMQGSTRTILAGERVILNLLQLASSVATKTARFVREVAPYPCDILDTRKTYAGLRPLLRYAVRIGGGKNHRDDLASGILIKDNHLAHTSIEESIQKARALRPDLPIEIEVDTLAQLKEALTYQPNAIMLDNMSPEMVQEAVQIAGGKVYLEASGGITLSNVRSYAKSGVNGISIGALTHSIDAIDLSLNM